MIDLCTQKNHTPPGGGLASLTVQCAWCLREQGRAMGNGSHGICADHKARMLATWRARKQGRQA